MLYDGLIVPDGAASVEALARNAHAIDFVREQYRHCKPVLVLGAGEGLLDKAMVPKVLPDGSADPGLVIGAAAGADAALDKFKLALAGHRAFARETDPPAV